jgi:hypothetical protein
MTRQEVPSPPRGWWRSAHSCRSRAPSEMCVMRSESLICVESSVVGARPRLVGIQGVPPTLIGRDDNSRRLRVHVGGCSGLNNFGVGKSWRHGLASCGVFRGNDRENLGC